MNINIEQVKRFASISGIELNPEVIRGIESRINMEPIDRTKDNTEDFIKGRNAAKLYQHSLAYRVIKP